MAFAGGGLSRSAASFRWGFAAVLAVAGALAVGAKAQVIEIGASGRAVTYDRPSVFDGSGVAPIVLPRVVRKAGPHPTFIIEAAQATEVGEDLIAAVAWRESRMRPGVVSRAGALGEMQLMRTTARALGVDPADSRQNYRGGAAYLHRLLARYDGDLLKTLAAYNAGPGAVDRYQGVPPYPETQAYVAAVLERLSSSMESGR